MIWFLLVERLLIAGCTHVFTLVSPVKSFYVTDEVLCTLLLIWFSWKVALTWWCLKFWCWCRLENNEVASCHKYCYVWLILLGSIITNDLTMWDIFLLSIGILSCSRGGIFPVPFTMSNNTCARRPKLLEKYFSHVFLSLLILNMCIYSSDYPV